MVSCINSIILIVCVCLYLDVQLRFEQPVYNVDEADGNSIVTIELDKESPVDIPLLYRTTAGTATGKYCNFIPLLDYDKN